MKFIIASTAVLAAMTAACPATDAQALPDALLACGKVQDTTERAHCYDTQIAALKKSAPTAASVAQPGSTAPPAATAGRTQAAPVNPVAAQPQSISTPSEAEKFGQDDLPASRRPKVPEQDQVLQSSISSVRSVGPAIWLISLANGQVWRQDGTSTPQFFKAGDTVRIDKGELGDYRLAVPRIGEKNWVRVNRLK